MYVIFTNLFNSHANKILKPIPIIWQRGSSRLMVGRPATNEYSNIIMQKRNL